ncbi:hypothetical protein [Nocardia camponoti]|uniref:Uncharacterized protein n=1 Tax=Nocardia camponoti TaxID=1616106 RepID=A0A917QU87_9NOCA|nr:hypothetical protein [Nocardia camponoti]GGK67456.1 hypothetical protein GCM10011591_44510 [Nocardia camponoti]
MTAFEFDPDQVRTLGQGFHQSASDIALADVDGNSDLLTGALPGSLTAAMCGTVSGIAANAQRLVATDLRSLGQGALVAVGEVTGRDESAATEIARGAQGVR